MNYWDNPKWFQERNKHIVKDKESGMGMLDLSIKYKLSSTRIFAIVSRNKLGKEKK